MDGGGFSDFPVDGFDADGMANDEDMLNYFLSSGIGEGLDGVAGVNGAAALPSEGARGRAGSTDDPLVDHMRSGSFDEVMAKVNGANASDGGVGRDLSNSGELFGVGLPGGYSPNVVMYPGTGGADSPRSSDLSSRVASGSEFGRDSDLRVPLPQGVGPDLGLDLSVGLGLVLGGGDADSTAPGAAPVSGMKQSASSAMISSFGAASLSGEGGGGGGPSSSASAEGSKGKRAAGKRRSKNQTAASSSAAASQRSDIDDNNKNSKALTAEEKKTRRLARNRESARQSRRRKKQYLELLEDKVEQLTQEVNTLRQRRLEQAPKELHQHWANNIVHLAKQLESDSSPFSSSANDPHVERMLKQNISIMKKRFGPNSPEYVRILNHHFDLMQSIMLPPYTRFLLWAMDQGGDFFKTGSQRNRGKLKQMAQKQGAAGTGSAANLWPLVWNELGLTFEQEEKTKSTFLSLNSEENIAARRQLVIGVNLLDRIHRVAIKHGEDMHTLSDQLQGILTPQQQVRFFAWYDKNRKRIHDCGLDRGLAGELSRISSAEAYKAKQASGKATANTGDAADRIHSLAAALCSKTNEQLNIYDACEFLDVLVKDLTDNHRPARFEQEREALGTATKFGVQMGSFSRGLSGLDEGGSV